MAVFIGNALNNTANAPAGILIGFAGGNLAQLQDAFGDVIVGLRRQRCRRRRQRQ